MPSPNRLLATLFVCTALCTSATARERVLVIGDSLSREYQFEFAEFEEARNWVELLAMHRPDDFFFGSLESSDLGALALICDLFSPNDALCNAIGDDGDLERYRYNWAIPTYSAEAYADDLTGSGPFENLIQDLIDDDFDDVDSVVIFLGGNDIDRVYSSIYNGNSTTSNQIVASIERDLEAIIDFVLDDTPDMRIVLVNTPHVGATPEVKGDYPNDPIRTARVTTTLQRLDTNLRALADRRGIGYADILGLTIDLLPDDPYCLGGVPFLNQGSDNGDPHYLWLGGELSQNFHPNTNGQAIVANAIISAYNEKYGLGVTPFSESEIVESLLGLQTPLSEWAESFGLAPGDRGADDDPELDGLDNLIEFALGLDPSAPSTLPAATMVGGNLIYEYEIAPQACDQIVTIPEYSQDLIHWRPVPGEQITAVSENRFRISLTSTTGMQYLRLKVQFRTAGSL